MEKENKEEMIEIFEKLLTNPQTRTAVLELIKEQIPDLPIPEIDIVKKVKKDVDEKIKEIEKEKDELKRKLEEKEIQEKYQRLKDTFRTKYKFSDDEIVEVEKIMIEKKVLDPDAAAKLYMYEKSLAEGPAGFEQPAIPIPDEKELKQNPKKWARTQALKVIQELKRT